MSDTPRTEDDVLSESVRIIASSLINHDGVAFAALHEAANRIEELHELRKDKERLDWLLRYCSILKHRQQDQKLYTRIFKNREAIDAAMKEALPPAQG